MGVPYLHPRGSRASLNLLAGNSLLRPGQIYVIVEESRIALAMTTSTYEVYAKLSEALDVWTRVILASDFVNATVTFNTITGMSFTPPANRNWTIEGELLLQTPLTTNMPRLGLLVAAGQSYYAGEIRYTATAATQVLTEFWGTTGLGNHQLIAGTAPVQGQPYMAWISAKGRSGASPTAISLQLAAESAAANAAIVKQGSEFRYRTYS